MFFADALFYIFWDIWVRKMRNMLDEQKYIPIKNILTLQLLEMITRLMINILLFALFDFSHKSQIEDTIRCLESVKSTRQNLPFI